MALAFDKRSSQGELPTGASANKGFSPLAQVSSSAQNILDVMNSAQSLPRVGEIAPCAARVNVAQQMSEPPRRTMSPDDDTSRRLESN